VVIDPMTALIAGTTVRDASRALLRLVDHLKGLGTTAMFVSLTSGGEAESATELGISSLMDTWLLLRSYEQGGELRRALVLLKSRGMAHSLQVRDFEITARGIELAGAPGRAEEAPDA
jgi:circadian clock protein KaiC